MKLILENWKKFISEEKIEEATTEEIDYLNDLLETPIEKLPFGNIFGDSYRLIEPLESLDETSSFGVAMKALARMGWEVGPAKNGKILCTKTKVSHYIDGKGNQGVSRKTISLNLPKVLAGIINFAKNSRDKLQREAGAEIFTAAKRYADAAKEGKLDELPADVKYGLPASVSDPNIKHTANEYRKAMKFYDNQIYWLGTKTSLRLSAWAKSVGINFESFENFAKYASDSFDDLLANMDQYVQKSYIIYSRHPVDVFRMSDHEGIKSCHSLPSSKGGFQFDEYNICALSEAYGNGMIAYAIPAKNFKMFPPTQESLDNLGNEEIFYDSKRPKEDMIKPSSRIRIKHVSHRMNKDSEATKIAVPQGKIYGPKIPGFLDAVQNKMASTQQKEINNIINVSGKTYGEGHVKLSEFTRYGGSYQDSGYSVAGTLPSLFRKISKDVEFHGSSVDYNEDLERSMFDMTGQGSLQSIEEELNRIFDEYSGGMISFDWDADHDWDGNIFFRYTMNVRFALDIPGKLLQDNDTFEKIREDIEESVDYGLTDYYTLPQSDGVFYERYSNDDRLYVVIKYTGHDLNDNHSGFVEDLEGELEDILHNDLNIQGIFDYYHDDGPIQLIEYHLKKNGIIESEEFNIYKVMQQYGLPEESWWNEVDREEGSSPFNGDIVESISFEDEFSFFPHELVENLSDELKEQAFEHIADFCNFVSSANPEPASRITLGVKNWNKEDFPEVVMNIQQALLRDITPLMVAAFVEGEEDMVARCGLTIGSDNSLKSMNFSADFLANKADIDKVHDRFVAALNEYLLSKMKKQIKENKKRIKVYVKRQ